MAKIRILVADDHTILRAGLKLLLNSQPDMEVVGEAANGREAVENAIRLLPDVVLMDLTMPSMDGFEAAQQLRQRLPKVKVLVLTVHDDEAYLFQALRMGAQGYVVKSAADTELIQAIRAVQRGEVYLQPAAVRLLADHYTRRTSVGEQEPGWRELSPREQEILTLVAAGHTSAQIAHQLGLSARTVESHRANIMAKLGFTNRAQLVSFALRKGLLSSID